MQQEIGARGYEVLVCQPVFHDERPVVRAAASAPVQAGTNSRAVRGDSDVSSERFVGSYVDRWIGVVHEKVIWILSYIARLDRTAVGGDWSCSLGKSAVWAALVVELG